jgi:peptidoglycan/xylan/chitin deacetylase (PgdA/CDA1 family)
MEAIPPIVRYDQMQNSYCMWPDDTISEIALNAGIDTETLLSHNPSFQGHAGTTLQLPPGSIAPAYWYAPPPQVNALEELPFGVSGYYIGHNNREKRVALTFDIGYVEENELIIEGLAEQGIRATFFVLGIAVARHPDMIRRILESGHELANHSFTHENMLEMTEREIRFELNVTENSVKNAYPGATTKPYFRAPFGAINSQIIDVAQEEGYHVIGWTVDSSDWTDNVTPQIIYNRVTQNVCPGAIIAMHDVNDASAVALPQILDFLQENGYEFVTVSEILRPDGQNALTVEQ